MQVGDQTYELLWVSHPDRQGLLLEVSPGSAKETLFDIFCGASGEFELSTSQHDVPVAVIEGAIAIARAEYPAVADTQP